MNPLFPELPENLEDEAALSDDKLVELYSEHEVAVRLIEEEDENFLQGMSAGEVVEALKSGIDQMEAIKAEQDRRREMESNYSETLKEQLARLSKEEEEVAEEEPEVEEQAEEAEDKPETPELVTAAGEPEDSTEPEEQKPAAKAPLRRPPRPSRERQLREQGGGTFLTAAGGVEGVQAGTPVTRDSLAQAMAETARRWGGVTKSDSGIEQRLLMASAKFQFPEERQLHREDWQANAEKIRKVGSPFFGQTGIDALLASGGLCAPLEPIYSIPNFAVMDRPVRDALPSFQANRGGVNVPVATDISSITTAISNITSDNDALGGTFATKSFQAINCTSYTNVPVNIISHIREYGNLNTMAWPEKIAHENDLTMAAHARTADAFLLDRIKAQSLAVTQAKLLNSFADLSRALEVATSAIRYRLRMRRDASFRILAPSWLPDQLAVDQSYVQFDRFEDDTAMADHLAREGLNISYYLDTPSTGTSQGWAAEVGGGTLDQFPNTAQIAVFPEGAFIHVDSGSLELGIIRDSTLNSTNDYQIFGETFENVARLGSVQSALWLSVGVCPTGEFPALATALTCP